MKVKLTQQYINSPPPVPTGTAKVERCDLAMPGFLFEQRANSEFGSFRLRYKNSSGKTSYAAIGRSCDITLKEARQKARQLRAEIQLGADPQAETRARKTVMTWDEYFPSYLKHAKHHLRSWANLEEMQVRTLVDETDMGQISAGLSASVQVEAFPGRTFQGTVDKVEPQATVQQNVTMFPVIVLLDNQQGLLRPGMNAEVETLLVERPNVLVVPNNAVVLPQEMAPAASVLGLDPEAIEFDQNVYMELARAAGLGSVQGMGRSRGGSGGGAPEGARGQRPGGGDAASATPQEGGVRPEAPAGMAGFRSQMDSLRAQVERGEISQDSLDAVRNGFRARMGAEGRGMPEGMTGAPEGHAAIAESNPALSGLVNTAGAPRAAVAFVVREDGTLEMRPVLMGVNDWDNSEILAGLEEGEQVALIGAAQLQAQQEEMMNRMRGMGGGMFGGMRR